MPVRQLPPNASLDHLKHQAKDLRKSHAQRIPTDAQRLREFHPRFSGQSDDTIFNAPLSLSDAQLTIAREHGFLSWARMKAHIAAPVAANRRDLPHHERISDPAFRQALYRIDTGDDAGLKKQLAEQPSLIRQQVLFEGTNYFREPSLLEFIAENPIRHGRLSPKVLEVTQTLLEAGPEPSAVNDTLGLLVTGNIAAASSQLVPLIALLCAHGADGKAALQTATLHGEVRSMRALLQQGAPITLAATVALNLEAEFTKLLPDAIADERHLAMALCAQYNRVPMMRQLLDAGEDPNRYNPVGGHSHGMPLHHASGFGYLAMVRLLVERGARMDLKDVLWHGTPAEWARHEGRTEVAAFLCAAEEQKR